MTERSDRSSDAQWIRSGRGIGPSVKWTFGTEGPLSGVQLARESGEVLASDETGGLYRLDRKGQYAAVTRTREPIRQVALSDDGEVAAAIVGENSLHCFNRQLKTEWQIELPSQCLAIAMNPYGQYIAVSLTEAGNVIYDVKKRRVARFDSIRPLTHLRFVTTEPTLMAAADHGLLCCVSLGGERLWEEKVWSNVGSMAITGDGELIYLATYAHGIQVFDGDGDSVGSYVVEGAVKQIAASYEPHRVVASTLERHLYLLDPDGEMLWAARTPQDVAQLACDPLGEFVVCGFADGHVVGLDWSRG